jgi:hypothetical protein
VDRRDTEENYADAFFCLLRCKSGNFSPIICNMQFEISATVILMIKSAAMKWKEHIKSMEGMKNMYKF